MPKITVHNNLTNDELIRFVEFKTPTQELIMELLTRFCRMVDERKNNDKRTTIQNES